jgi:hypothetical protein
MPKLLCARPPQHAEEERPVCKLANSQHAPADWVFHAKMVVRRWTGQRTTAIASELHCRVQTVRERLTAVNERGIDGLGMPPGSGRRPRLTQLERRQILELVKFPPPGKAALRSGW